MSSFNHKKQLKACFGIDGVTSSLHDVGDSLIKLGERLKKLESGLSEDYQRQVRKEVGSVEWELKDKAKFLTNCHTCLSEFYEEYVSACLGLDELEKGED